METGELHIRGINRATLSQLNQEADQAEMTTNKYIAEILNRYAANMLFSDAEDRYQEVLRKVTSVLQANEKIMIECTRLLRKISDILEVE